MARLPDALDSLGPDGKKVYEKIARKRGAIRGPFAPLLHHPALAERVADVGEYLRFESGLPADVRELAVLLTARHVVQPFEWVAHAPIARTAGLPEHVIELVRTQGDVGSLPPQYADAARLVQHVLARRSIPRELQDRVAAALGTRGVVELVVIAGYYQMIAAVLTSFDVPLPGGASAPF
jgi:4-carboxymuconolactone decarboxylase